MPETPPQPTKRSRPAQAAAWLVVGAVALAALGTLGWRRSHRRPPPPGPVTSTLVAMSGELGSDTDKLDAAWSALEELAQTARLRHAQISEGWPDSLVHVLFDGGRFTREIDENAPRFYRLVDVLSGRRGNCLGLVGLYLALAERVGAPADAVRVPGHVFVRTREARPRNLEMLRRGEAMPDDWYRARYGPWSTGDDGYFRPLSLAELEALAWYDVGGYHLAHGQPQEAVRDFDEAVARAPRFAEAAASLAATRRLVLHGAEKGTALVE